MQFRLINPVAQEMLGQLGQEQIDELWSNDEYEVQVRYLDARGKAGAIHLSLKRRDRTPARDFRHLMSIKNEVCGEEREAFELYPAESRLVDGANQTHLWVMAAGEVIPIGFDARIVQTEAERQETLRAINVDPSNGSQREWQTGLKTGRFYKPRGRYSRR